MWLLLVDNHYPCRLRGNLMKILAILCLGGFLVAYGCFAQRHFIGGFSGLLVGFGAMLVGIGSNPARDAPNGYPEAVMVGYLCIAIGICLGIYGAKVAEEARKQAAAVEQQKLEGDLSTLSQEERKYAEMYRVMTSGAFAYAYNTCGSRMLKTRENEWNKVVMNEMAGALFVKKERDYSKEHYPLGGFSIDNINEATVIMDRWEENYYPPDQINKVVTKELKRMLPEEADQENMESAMMDILFDFDSCCRKAVGQRNVIGQNIEKEAEVKRNNIVTTGLDYGIITNSVVNLALYDVLNENEHRKQAKSQQYSLSISNDYKQQCAAAGAYGQIMRAYHTYMLKAKKIIELSINGTVEI